MRDGDRFWWVRLVGGILPCALVMVGAYILFTLFPGGASYLAGGNLWQELLSDAFPFLLCLVTGVGLALTAPAARRRHRLRLAAWRGDDSAMPPADIRVDPSRAPDVTQLPIELLWRVARTSAAGVGLTLQVGIAGIQLALLVVVVGVVDFALVGPLILPAQLLPEGFILLPTTPVSATEIALRIAGAFAILLAGVGLALLFWRILPLFFGRRFGIIADASGIEVRTVLGTRRRVPWAEMRLFEVSGSAEQSSKRRFDLYAPGNRVTWTEYQSGASSTYTPIGATASEMALRQEALLNLIAARTGLVPRTLSKELRSAETPPEGGIRRRIVIASLLGCLLVGGLAAAVYFFPTTSYSWLNSACVASLTVTACVLLAIAIRTALWPRAMAQPGSTPLSGTPSLEAPGVAYSLSWKTPLARRAVSMFIGAILIVNLVPLVQTFILMFLPQVSSALPGLRPDLLTSGLGVSFGSFMLAFMQGGCGLAGLALAFRSTQAMSRVRVDETGIAQISARRTQFVPWSGLREVSWGRGLGGEPVYEVRTDTPTVSLEWPAEERHTAVAAPTDGAIPIGPDELAALVAARIGKPIRVRH